MGLFSKDWQDSDEGKALAWVRRQSGDKRALAQAAMKAPSYNVKVAAVEQLESQELLKLVATSEEHTDSDVKSMAMRKISDQAFLADYASKGWAAAISGLPGFLQPRHRASIWPPAGVSRLSILSFSR